MPDGQAEYPNTGRRDVGGGWVRGIVGDDGERAGKEIERKPSDRDPSRTEQNVDAVVARLRDRAVDQQEFPASQGGGHGVVADGQDRGRADTELIDERAWQREVVAGRIEGRWSITDSREIEDWDEARVLWFRLSGRFSSGHVVGIACGGHVRSSRAMEKEYLIQVRGRIQQLFGRAAENSADLRKRLQSRPL